jgi:hypothetical protein
MGNILPNRPLARQSSAKDRTNKSGFETFISQV